MRFRFSFRTGTTSFEFDSEECAERPDDLRRRAYEDRLTGLANAVALEDELDRLTGTNPMSVLVLDFDGLRAANEAFGYADGGDVLIRAVGQALAALARPGEFPARMHTAGDEFVLLLPGLAKGEGAGFQLGTPEAAKAASAPRALTGAVCGVWGIFLNLNWRGRRELALATIHGPPLLRGGGAAEAAPPA